MLDNVIQFMRLRSSDLLIGKLAGTGSLGLFNLASEVASLPQAVLTAPINRVLLPGYARLSSDIEQLRETYLSVIGVTTLTAVPISAGIAAIAPLLVPLALGDHWLPAIPALRILGVASALALTGTGAAIAYLALGRPALVVTVGASYVAVLLLAMRYLVPRLGTSGAAWSVLAATVLNLPLQLTLVRRVLGPVLGAWFAVVWRPALAAATRYAAVSLFVLRTAMPNAFGALLAHTLAAVSLGVVCYVGCVSAGWLCAGRPRGAEQRALELVRTFFVKAPRDVRSAPVVTERPAHAAPRLGSIAMRHDP